jgi:hypothetical protein
MDTPSEDHLNPTAQADVHQDQTDMAAHTGDEPTTDESLGNVEFVTSEPATEGGDDQYDPMSILAVDPDASSVGSMIEDDRIADDLIAELEEHDQEHHKA